ncbi:MAG: MotA/TolQ/ExbB proton channel family protein [Nitrospiraceae bacterium]|nr:MotA/TolQ/ExbB proton channel family protein [Nitrospiraceae bacterium]
MLAIAAMPGLGMGALGLFGETGWVGKGIVLILMGFSVVSWAMILLKYQFLRRAEKESHAFLLAFRKTKKMDDLIKQAESKKFSPLATLFIEGHREAEAIIKSLPDMKVTDEERPLISQEIERSLKITTQDEIVYMERYLAFLGTTGTVGPLLGLFGTVWGIMDAFYGIGLKGAGDIGALAPGLAAALINTISGLFVAIPAVIAYNYFADKIRDIAIRCDSFSMEYLSYLERNLLRRKV